MKLKNLNYKRLRVKYYEPEFELIYTYNMDGVKSSEYSQGVYFEPEEWLKQSNEDSETWENIIIKAYGYIEELLDDPSKAKEIHHKLNDLGNESSFFELENYNGGEGWYFFDEYDYYHDNDNRRIQKRLRPVEDYQMQIIENLVYMIVKMDLVLQVHSA